MTVTVAVTATATATAAATILLTNLLPSFDLPAVAFAATQVVMGYEVPLFMTNDLERQITVKAEYVNGVAVLTCPSKYHLGHGVPGTAACVALLAMYKKSRHDYRFHPTYYAWSHAAFHLVRHKAFAAFKPKAFCNALPVVQSSAQQLWPPNSWKGSGRPRQFYYFYNANYLYYTYTGSNSCYSYYSDYYNHYS